MATKTKADLLAVSALPIGCAVVFDKKISNTSALVDQYEIIISYRKVLATESKFLMEVRDPKGTEDAAWIGKTPQDAFEPTANDDQLLKTALEAEVGQTHGGGVVEGFKRGESTGARSVLVTGYVITGSDVTAKPFHLTLDQSDAAVLKAVV